MLKYKNAHYKKSITYIIFPAWNCETLIKNIFR